MDRPASVAELTQLLRDGGYLADRGLATALFVALSLGRPILIEGEVGVGKTEVAKALATVFGRRLIRLQCYEGIDTNQALYEWDYARQMLQIRALSERQLDRDEAVDKLFGPKFLLERPLLEAVRAGDRAVLLIDEIDRADDEFEAFLLELLSDFQITIPEIGTIRAQTPPLVVLTSNRTRELHDALKRRCLYHWVDYPSPEREVEIVLVRAPGVSETLARKVVAAVNRLRGLDLAKPPGVAETIDWVRTLDVLGETDLDARTVAGHAGRGREGARRPGAGARQPGRDRPRVPDAGAARSARWSAFGRAAAGGRAGASARATCSPTARPWPRSTRPTCSTCTGPGAPRWSTRRDHIPVYDRVFRRFFLDECGRAARAAQAHRPRRGRRPESVLQVPATEPGTERGAGAAGDARPGRVRRRGAAAQGVRGLHRRRAGGPAADHGADAAHPAAAADPAHDGRRARPARPTCAAPCARRCARTASRRRCSGAAGGCGSGR